MLAVVFLLFWAFLYFFLNTENIKQDRTLVAFFSRWLCSDLRMTFRDQLQPQKMRFNGVWWYLEIIDLWDRGCDWDEAGELIVFCGRQWHGQRRPNHTWWRFCEISKLLSLKHKSLLFSFSSHLLWNQFLFLPAYFNDLWLSTKHAHMLDRGLALQVKKVASFHWFQLCATLLCSGGLRATRTGV